MIATEQQFARWILLLAGKLVDRQKAGLNYSTSRCLSHDPRKKRAIAQEGSKAGYAGR